MGPIATVSLINEAIGLLNQQGGVHSRGRKKGKMTTAIASSDGRAAPLPLKTVWEQLLVARAPLLSSSVFSLYDKIVLDSEVFHEGVRKRKLAATEARAVEKKRKVMEARACVVELLGDEPWVPWVLESRYLARLMEPLKKAPSKGTKKRLQEVVDLCVERFEAVHQTGVMSFDMFGGTDPLNLMLRSYFLRSFPGATFAVQASDRVFELILAGDPLAAVLSTLNQCDFGLAIQSTVDPTDEFSPFAAELCRRRASWSGVTMEVLQTTYGQVASEFAALAPVAREYLLKGWMSEAELESSVKVPRFYMLKTLDADALRSREFSGMFNRAKDDYDRAEWERWR